MQLFLCAQLPVELSEKSLTLMNFLSFALILYTLERELYLSGLLGESKT